MDFIEHWLHLSPDAGNGSVELLWIAALIVGILGAAVALRRSIFAALIWYLRQLGSREHDGRHDA